MNFEHQNLFLDTVRRGDVEQLRQLLLDQKAGKIDIDINGRGQSESRYAGLSALDVASQYGHLEIILILFGDDPIVRVRMVDQQRGETAQEKRYYGYTAAQLDTMFGPNRRENPITKEVEYFAPKDKEIADAERKRGTNTENEKKKVEDFVAGLENATSVEDATKLFQEFKTFLLDEQNMVGCYLTLKSSEEGKDGVDAGPVPFYRRALSAFDKVLKKGIEEEMETQKKKE